MRVQARNSASGQVLATVDTVTPISGEANCQGCHAASIDGGNGSAIANLPANMVANAFEDAIVDRVTQPNVSRVT